MRPATGPAVFLHIGEPKSGTTFLQDVMWANRDALERQGVLLAGAHAGEQFRAALDLREVPQAGDDPSGSYAGEWDALARHARTASRVAVISVETLVGTSAKQAARAIASLRPADVHIVLTVRDLATLLPAEWQETIKHRNTAPWEQWLEQIVDAPVPTRGRGRWFWQAHDTERILSRWAPHVPADHVHVITMPRAGAPVTLLWERFASVIGVDPASVDTATARPNASLGPVEVELLRRINTALPKDVPNWFYSNRVKDRIAHRALAERPKPPRLTLNAERRKWATGHANELIAMLDRSGYDIVGDLAELRPVAPRGKRLESADVTAEQVLDAAVDAMSWLLQDEYELAVAQRSEPSAKARAKLVHDVVVPWLHELAARYPKLARVVRDVVVRAGRRARSLRR